MTHARDKALNPSSPHSSAGAVDSLKGTPDTRLTAFSPCDGSAKPSTKLLPNFTQSTTAVLSGGFTSNNCPSSLSHFDRDPFVSPMHETRLSPTASSFRPVVSFSGYASRNQNEPVSPVLSTELGLSRHLEISSSVPLSVAEVDRGLAENGMQFYDSRELEAIDKHIHVHFSDLRDAVTAFSGAQKANPDWQVQYTGSNEILREPLQDIDASVAEHGQILVLVSVSPRPVVDIVYVTEIARGLLESCGKLYAFVRQTSFMNGYFRAVAQYCNPTAAMAALEICDGLSFEGVHIAVKCTQASSASELTSVIHELSLEKKVDEPKERSGVTNQTVSDLDPAAAFPMYPFMFQAPVTQNMPYVLDRVPQVGQANQFASLTPSYSIIGPMYQAPPSPALTANHEYSPARAVPAFGRMDARRQHATRIARTPYNSAANHHNHVDIGRIREGIDVRTTIMLRNIPNKVDQAMLKRLVDDSSWGKYDFMYLRIDFANDCNVGYAFINFVDPLDIIDFVNVRGNQRWNCFKSDKVAEISYATIQGKDCLVQKFRNSSVMLEAPHYRPKLYFTSNGPVPELAGQEEPFPGPDNQSKMKRSCENAEHVGLFTPNAGQHFRDEQRRRRSQYDRGTRLAALEEYDYEASIQHLYGAPTQ